VKAVPLFPWILPLLVLAFCGFSEEKNGLWVTVAKATTARADERGALVNTDIIDRTKGLKVTVTNTSLKPMPAGDVEWQILVRKYDSASILSYEGTEKLKALGKGEAVELAVGSVPILGMHDGAAMAMDKIEWRLVIKREGVEVFSAVSSSRFNALVKRAVPGAPPAPSPPAAKPK
jgi:hypothetical protein